MKEVTIQEAQARLRELIAQLQPGEQVAIIDQGKIVATMTRVPDPAQSCKAGS